MRVIVSLRQGQSKSRFLNKKKVGSHTNEVKHSSAGSVYLYLDFYIVGAKANLSRGIKH